MGAAIGVFCLSLGDGLHGGIIQATADTVAAAARHGGHPGPANPGSRRGAKVLGRKPFCVNPWGAWRAWGECLGASSPRLGPLLGALGGLSQEFAWCLGQDGTLEDLGRRHAVAGIRAAAFLEQQQLKLLVGRVGLFGISVDEAWGPLAVCGRHSAAG